MTGASAAPGAGSSAAGSKPVGSGGRRIGGRTSAVGSRETPKTAQEEPAAAAKQGFASGWGAGFGSGLLSSLPFHLGHSQSYAGLGWHQMSPPVFGGGAASQLPGFIAGAFVTWLLLTFRGA